MATLYLMVGIPGAGKTTYAKRRLSKAIRIGSDDIRKELFGKELTLKGYRNVHRILQRKTARYLANEQDVVVDCMNASVRARKVYFQLLPSNSSIVAIYLDTPFRIALQNNRRRKRQVPPAGILWNWLRIRKPKEKEGFDQVIVEHYKPHNQRKGLDRKRVENVWKGTWINKHSAYDHRIFICSRCRKQISIQGEMLQFCPACGAANTDRAIDIVMCRLTNVYRDSLRCKKLEQIKKKRTTKMTKERCMTLLDQVIDHVIVGQNTKGAIHELLQIGFTKNELIHEFSFAKEDVEQVQEE